MIVPFSPHAGDDSSHRHRVEGEHIFTGLGDYTVNLLVGDLEFLADCDKELAVSEFLAVVRTDPHALVGVLENESGVIGNGLELQDILLVGDLLERKGAPIRGKLTLTVVVPVNLRALEHGCHGDRVEDKFVLAGLRDQSIHLLVGDLELLADSDNEFTVSEFLAVVRAEPHGLITVLQNEAGVLGNSIEVQHIFLVRDLLERKFAPVGSEFALAMVVPIRTDAHKGNGQVLRIEHHDVTTRGRLDVATWLGDGYRLSYSDLGTFNGTISVLVSPRAVITYLETTLYAHRIADIHTAGFLQHEVSVPRGAIDLTDKSVTGLIGLDEHCAFRPVVSDVVCTGHSDLDILVAGGESLTDLWFVDLVRIALVDGALGIPFRTSGVEIVIPLMVSTEFELVGSGYFDLDYLPDAFGNLGKVDILAPAVSTHGSDDGPGLRLARLVRAGLVATFLTNERAEAAEGRSDLEQFRGRIDENVISTGLGHGNILTLLSSIDFLIYGSDIRLRVTRAAEVLVTPTAGCAELEGVVSGKFHTLSHMPFAIGGHRDVLVPIEVTACDGSSDAQRTLLIKARISLERLCNSDGSVSGIVKDIIIAFCRDGHILTLCGRRK